MSVTINDSVWRSGGDPTGIQQQTIWSECAVSSRWTIERLSPGKKRQRKRMATVAAVYSTPRFVLHPEQIIGHDVESPQRPDIANKRVWASVEHDAQTVIGSAFDEAVRRDP
jgi:hypothetical protein